MKICTIEQMRGLTQQAEHEYHISDEIITEHLAMQAQQTLERRIGMREKWFVALCGDDAATARGCAVARQLHAHGATVRVYFLRHPSQYSDTTQRQIERLRCLPLDMGPISTADAPTIAVLHCDAVVDALVDASAAETVTGLAAELIDMVNDSRRPVISLGLPSGIHADTGRVLGIAMRAAYTVVRGVPTIGNILYPGYEHCGELVMTAASLPPALRESDTMPTALNAPLPLPPRSATGHKGSFGDVLVIAGAGTYYGAPYFSATAVLKAGGGYSRLAAPASIIPVIAAKSSELVYVPQPETDTGSLAADTAPALLELAEQVDLVILGPGLSLHEDTQRLARELAAAIPKPLLIDGDGITAICQRPDALRQRTAETIITPHPGEMSRLTGQSVRDITTNPLAILRQATESLNAFIVLKGAHSLIGYPDGRVFVNMSGNSGMGTAGSGDVLTGTIAAMFGLGLSVPEAVRQGVFVHGLAGDLAADARGEDGITAQDILDTLPDAVQLARRTLPLPLRQRYLLQA